MKTQVPEVNYEVCIACSMCVVVCPGSSLEMSKTGIDPLNKPYPALNHRACSGCALCESHCPMGAIQMKGAA